MTFVKFKKGPGLDTLLHEVLNSSLADVAKTDFANSPSRPAANISQTADALTLELAIPGLTKKDINIQIEKDLLTVSAAKEKQDNRKFVRKQFDFNKFKRTFRLPDTVDQKSISAAFKNGILSITLNKKEEAKDMPPRTIKIK